MLLRFSADKGAHTRTHLYVRYVTRHCCATFQGNAISSHKFRFVNCTYVNLLYDLRCYHFVTSTHIEQYINYVRSINYSCHCTLTTGSTHNLLVK